MIFVWTWIHKSSKIKPLAVKSSIIVFLFVASSSKTLTFVSKIFLRVFSVGSISGSYFSTWKSKGKSGIGGPVYWLKRVILVISWWKNPLYPFWVQGCLYFSFTPFYA